MEGIQVSVEKIGPQSDISIIRVGGYIDTTTSSELERALDSLLKAGVFRVIIDLGNVDYISSAGWGIFISEIKGMRERNGDLKLARMIPDVYEVFELLEFHYILKAFDTVEEAINSFEEEMGISTLKREKREIIADQPEIMPEEPETEIQNIPEELEEKIRQLALENVSWGPSLIARELNTEKYGFIRVGTLAVWRYLRKLKLGGRKQREEASGKSR
jgi:anti-sigma B factor antagonist